jgi:hypothetical protein
MLGEGNDVGPGDGDWDVGDGLGRDRMGDGLWETGWVGVDGADGEVCWDDCPAGCCPAGEVQALAGTCPAAAAPGAWP